MPKVTLNMNIEKSLRDQLKIIAVEQDTTVTEIVTNLIETFVSEHKKQ